MKQIIFVVFFSLATSLSAQLKSEVNECFELVSIAFRLANADEYINNSKYTEDADNYFKEFEEHDLIHYIKKIRLEQNIGYDAVSTAASFLEISRNKVILKSNLKLNQIKEIDNRWTDQSFRNFIKHLNVFYQTSNFRTFFDKHNDLYQQGINKMNEQLIKFNIDWFKSFFRINYHTPLVIISFANGAHNYSFNLPTENGIVIGCGFDNKGIPIFSSKTLLLIVHEYLHNYANPIISNNWTNISGASQIIYENVYGEMNSNAYNNEKTMMFEWLTNLFTVIYSKENFFENIEDIVTMYQSMGFIWMDRSVSFMENFIDKRERFERIEDFIPQLTGFICYTASNFERIKTEYNNRYPYIIETFPISGSTVRPTTIDSINIIFSQEMQECYGFIEIDDILTNTPNATIEPFWSNETTFTIILDTTSLKDNNVYGFKLDKKGFKSQKGYFLEEDFTYTIKIKQ